MTSGPVRFASFPAASPGRGIFRRPSILDRPEPPSATPKEHQSPLSRLLPTPRAPQSPSEGPSDEQIQDAVLPVSAAPSPRASKTRTAGSWFTPDAFCSHCAEWKTLGQAQDHFDMALTTFLRSSKRSDFGTNGSDARFRRRSAATSRTISAVTCFACLPYPEISEFSQSVFASRGIPQHNLWMVSMASSEKIVTP